MKHSLVQSDRSQKGFSLIEVMVAMGVAAVLTYAISQMLVNSGKQAASIQSKGDFNSFVNQLQGALNNTNTCIAALSPGGVTGTKLKLSKDTTKGWPLPTPITLGGTQYHVGSTFGGPPTAAGGPTSKKALTVTKLELGGIQPGNTPNPNQFLTTLNMTVDRSVNGETAVAGNTLTKSFPILVTLDPTNGVDTSDPSNPKYSVVACAGQYSDFWITTGDTGQDILYSSGNVGIGSCPSGGVTPCVEPPQSGAALDVVGSIQATAFMYRSDARLKENVREIPDALDRVTKLHGVVFDWKDRSDPVTNRDQVGFIAQEVEKVFPEAVNTSPSSGLKTVGYGNLLAPLIEAFKEQKEIIARQQREIEELKQAVQKRGNGT